ncbi:MAG: YeeE/YedE family protein [Alphaproteobacteria bacterium]|nr:YeeE/YedE family protein [Alphaproteobacteria bacterium]
MPVSTPLLVALGGLAIGLLFGALVQRSNFCTNGGLSDRLLTGDGRRLRAWALAIAVAMLGTQSLQAMSLVDLGASPYRMRQAWAGQFLGGLVFGFGMALAGGCPSRALVRLGTGALAQFAVLACIAAGAFLTLRGPLAPFRLGLDEALAFDLLPAGAPLTGAAPLVLAATIALLLVWYCFREKTFRRPRDIIGGTGVGLLAAAGFALNGFAARDEFEIVPIVSLTFVGPLDEALRYLIAPADARLSFGFASLLGVVAGALASSLLNGRFHLRLAARRSEVARMIGGGLVMGVGGVLALGCSIGQGVTGLATLSTGSFAAMAGMLLGAVAGIRLLARLA